MPQHKAINPLFGAQHGATIYFCVLPPTPGAQHETSGCSCAIKLFICGKLVKFEMTSL
jgi:hypothetical protein